MGNFFKKVGIVVLASVMSAGLFNWVLGEGMWDSFGRTLVWVGVLLMLIGTVSGAGDFFTRPQLNSPADDAGEDESGDINKRVARESWRSFGTFLLFITGAVICFCIGTLFEYLF